MKGGQKLGTNQATQFPNKSHGGQQLLEIWKVEFSGRTMMGEYDLELQGHSWTLEYAFTCRSILLASV